MNDELTVSVHIPRLGAIGVATRLRLAAVGFATTEQADALRQLADAIDLAEKDATDRDRDLVNALCAGGELLRRLSLEALPVQGGPSTRLCHASRVICTRFAHRPSAQANQGGRA